MQRITHGTRYGYKKAKCRCYLCRQWQARTMREYRRRRGRPHRRRHREATPPRQRVLRGI